MMLHLSKTHRLLLMILMAIAYFAVELSVGHLCKSVTLVADSFHMLSDVLALLVALGAVRVAKKPSDRRHTYGFQRAEILGTLVNTVMLVTLCFTIIIEAVQKLVMPEPVQDPKLVLGVGAGGLLINLIGILLFCGHSHGHSHLSPEQAGDVDKLLQYQTVVVMSSVPDDVQQQPQAANSTAAGNGCDATAASADAAAAAAPDAPAAESAAKSAASSHGHAHAENGVGSPLLPNSPESQRRHVANGNAGGGVGGHSHKSGGQMNMHAAFLHIIGDTLGSVIVIVSALTLWLVPPAGPQEPQAEPAGNGTCRLVEPARAWQTFIDPVLSLVLVGIMLTSTVPLLLRALSILMQTVPQEICLDELREKLEQISGIIAIHDLHVWQLQSDCYIGTVHIRCTDLQTSEYISVSRAAKKIFHDFNIHCTTIQPEFSEHADQPDLEISDSQCIINCGDKCEAKSTCCATKPNGGETAPSSPQAAVPDDKQV